MPEPEPLREAALLVLQSQLVAQRKRPLALATALEALRSALDYPEPAATPSPDTLPTRPKSYWMEFLEWEEEAAKQVNVGPDDDRLERPDTLDAAWKEAEAALPRDRNGTAFNTEGGVRLLVMRLSSVDYLAEWGTRNFHGATPTAALRALAAALTETRG